MAMRHERGKWIGVAALGMLLVSHASAQSGSPPSTIETAASFKRADFANEQASRDVRHVADWVVDSSDNQDLPFAIIDKRNARIFVFDPRGRIRGAAPVLLGSARGDHSVPGIGEREMSAIRPEERTTPAGRFVAERGRNLNGEDIIWVDYDAAVSMHRVRANNPRERRLERLASGTPADNRISFGCINVPAKFYNTVVDPTFNSTKSMVYVLPDSRPVREVFGSYDVDARARRSGNSAARPRVVQETPSATAR